MGRQLLAYADLPVTIDVSWAFAPIGQIEGFVPGGVEVGEKNRYSAFKLDASLVWGAEHSGAEFAPRALCTTRSPIPRQGCPGIMPRTACSVRG